MRIVVTGGAGYIGSHTARLLAKQGHDVLIYDSLSRGHRRAAELAVGSGRLVEGDLLDEDRLDHALLAHRAEAVVHFAAYALVGESVARPELYWRNNVGGTLALLRCMARQKVAHIVFSSTCAVYGEPDGADIVESLPKAPVNPYGETKLASEWALAAHARAHGIGATALRYFNAAGADPDGQLGEDHDPETHLIPLAIDAVALQGKELKVFGTDWPTPDGTCIRDYVHVADLAEAHALALATSRSGVFRAINLGTGRGASVREVIDMVAAVTGKPVPHTAAPRRSGDPCRLVAGAGLAGPELGWVPRFSDLRTIVSTAWEWRRKHPRGYRSA